MTADRPPRWSDSLEEFLRSIASNKAAMADLRTGRNKPPEACMRMHRWVSPFVGDAQVNTGRERSVYAVASMFATHPDLRRTDRGLGTSLSRLRSAGRFSDTGIEGRLIRLCRSSTSEELCRNMPPVVSLIAAAEGAISWSALAADIDRWDFRSDRVSRRWLRDFYAPSPSGESADNTDNAEPGTTEREP